MFRKTIIVVASAALLATTVAPAQAALTGNGFSTNGFSTNGGGDNGVAHGLKGFAIDGIELPASR